MEKKRLLDLAFLGWYIGSILYAILLLFFDWNGPRNSFAPYYFEIVFLYLFEVLYITLWFVIIIIIRGLKWQLANWNVRDHKIIHHSYILSTLILFLLTGAMVFLLPRTWPGMLVRRIFAYLSWTFCSLLASYIYVTILNPTH
ncbi:MAG: hypothetical protein ACTSRG_16080 [Candidatus Helarchaeota archaeon]